MSTPAERAAISAILKKIPAPATIMDLGAYQGEDSAWMITACSYPPAPRCIMVEADKRNFDVLKQNFTAFWGVRAVMHHAAIADHTGTCEIYLCDNREGPENGSSSIRKPTGHLHHFPRFEFKRTETINCYTLDDLFEREELDHIDVLWADLQGAENQLIAGGQRALAKTKWLFIEAEEVEMYEGQSVRPDLLAMLPGWTVAQEFDYNLLLRNEHC
jgi:FkbM family methyltransferase